MLGLPFQVNKNNIRYVRSAPPIVHGRCVSLSPGPGDMGRQSQLPPMVHVIGLPCLTVQNTYRDSLRRSPSTCCRELNALALQLI